MIHSKKYGDDFKLTLFTSNPEEATIANSSNVNRIGVDLEIIGKEERQKGLDTRISRHTIADLTLIAQRVEKEKLFCRVNSLHKNSKQEIEEVIAIGATHILLPYFQGELEVEKFVAIIDGRASPIALVETASAVSRIKQICKVSGLGEIMIGLNDLHRSLRMENHFELLTSLIMDKISYEVLNAGILFTLGGVAPPSYKFLPIDPDLVIAQYPRLGAKGALISRSFFKNKDAGINFDGLIKSIRESLNNHGCCSVNELEQKRLLLQKQLNIMKSNRISL